MIVVFQAGQRFLQRLAKDLGRAAVLEGWINSPGHQANNINPEFEDFGEASLTLDSGVSCYCRLDWFNPRGSRVWGDGRTFVLGTEGYLEVRKYWDLGHGVVTSISTWRELRFDSSTDFDGTPFTIFHFPDNSEDQDQISQEIR